MYVLSYVAMCMHYKLLYVIQGIKGIFDKVTSWPQLISKLLVASAFSDWPHNFLYPMCFWFSINIYNNLNCIDSQVLPFSNASILPHIAVYLKIK